MGCGWLGTPLAQALLAEGHQVRGTTTSPEKLPALKALGLTPFMVSLSENKVQGPLEEFLKGVDILIVNVPPKLRGNHQEDYVRKMRLLREAVLTAGIGHLLFVGSTSVYGAASGEVTEDTIPLPETESGQQLLAAERDFIGEIKLRTTILRLAGLIGPNRHPVTSLSGKKGLANGNDPINLVHLDDCIKIIKSVILHNAWGQTYNVVYPLHPPKAEYYIQEAKKRGLSPPQYLEDHEKPGKTIISIKTLNGAPLRYGTSILG
jgi:nucleoside-diphosphate-sugar epimerase